MISIVSESKVLGMEFRPKELRFDLSTWMEIETGYLGDPIGPSRHPDFGVPV